MFFSGEVKGNIEVKGKLKIKKIEFIVFYLGLVIKWFVVFFNLEIEEKNCKEFICLVVVGFCIILLC